jgi:hypothetical protein
MHGNPYITTMKRFSKVAIVLGVIFLVCLLVHAQTNTNAPTGHTNTMSIQTTEISTGDPMVDQTANQFSKLFPQYASYITLAALLIGVIGRVYHAYKLGLGASGAVAGLVKGDAQAKQNVALSPDNKSPKPPTP